MSFCYIQGQVERDQNCVLAVDISQDCGYDCAETSPGMFAKRLALKDDTVSVHLLYDKPHQPDSVLM